jgi:hypothetical protein
LGSDSSDTVDRRVLPRDIDAVTQRGWFGRPVNGRVVVDAQPSFRAGQHDLIVRPQRTRAFTRFS